ncbi:MAG: D-alanyl-D-alanine carboxypeptidase family protein [Ruminococcus sp.]
MEIRNMTEKEFEEFQQLLARELGAVDKEKEKEEKEITEMLRHEGAAYEAARTVGKSLRDFAAKREAEERAAAEKAKPAEQNESAEESIDIEEMLKHDVQPDIQPEPEPQPEEQPQVTRGKYEKVTEPSDEPRAPKASELLKKPGKYEKITEEPEGYFNPERPRESAAQRRRRARKHATIVRYAVGLSALFIISLSAGLLVNSIKNNAKSDGEDKPVSAVQDESAAGECNIVSITPVHNYTALLAGAEKPVQIGMATTGAATAQDLLWVSSDTSVAEITEDGIIKGISPGTCDITISAKADPSISAQISCTVRKMEKIDGVTFVDGILLINKSYGVDADYDPGELTEETQNAFNELCAAAAEDDMNIYLASGYRSYETQGEIYDGYVVMYGEDLADTFSARPGFSEHQSGLAIDVNSIDDSFAETPEAEWLAKNCMDYGFIIRYAKDKVGITGYKYEPWHIRYVGKELADELTKLGLTLEEYLGVDSVYAEAAAGTNDNETESTTEE